MTYEMWMLVGVVIVFMVAVALQAITLIMAIGPATAAGNREDVDYPQPGLAGRAQRLVANHVEGLAMFAPLVLMAAIAGISTPMTILGSQLFLGSRIGHALCYFLGIPWLRSLIFGVGMAGLVMLLLAIMGF